jgi:hypothetical protein
MRLHKELSPDEQEDEELNGEILYFFSMVYRSASGRETLEKFTKGYLSELRIIREWLSKWLI